MGLELGMCYIIDDMKCKYMIYAILNRSLSEVIQETDLLTTSLPLLVCSGLDFSSSSADGRSVVLNGVDCFIGRVRFSFVIFKQSGYVDGSVIEGALVVWDLFGFGFPDGEPVILNIRVRFLVFKYFSCELVRCR